MKKDGLEKLQYLEVPEMKKIQKKNNLKERSEVGGKPEESGIPKAKRRKVPRRAQLLTELSKIRTEKTNVHCIQLVIRKFETFFLE